MEVRAPRCRRGRGKPSPLNPPGGLGEVAWGFPKTGFLIIFSIATLPLFFSFLEGASLMTKFAFNDLFTSLQNEGDY